MVAEASGPPWEHSVGHIEEIQVSGPPGKVARVLEDQAVHSVRVLTCTDKDGMQRASGNMTSRMTGLGELGLLDVWHREESRMGIQDYVDLNKVTGQACSGERAYQICCSEVVVALLERSGRELAVSDTFRQVSLNGPQ